MTSLSFHQRISIQERLLSWYRKEKRAMPWRETKDPYKIWVSEVMLQQTQVSTVLPYYRAWIRSFPSVISLAKAPLSKVLKLWEGLGYYRRARMLHSAAKLVAKSMGGRVPCSAEELIKLPGIGRYSAGAIASIAFGEKTPVLDGNVIRILTRLKALKKSVDLSATVSALWDTARSLLPDRCVGDFNQALMELGATVCFPQNPECGRCPWQKHCAAHKQGKEMHFPVKTRKDAYENVKMYAWVAEDTAGRVFLQKQPSGHWWAGLWTFPFFNTKQEFKESLRGVKGLDDLGTIRHGVTRYRIELRVFHQRIARKEGLLQVKGRWVPLGGLPEVALPSPHRKIANILIRSQNPSRLPRAGH
jgi:A/G-specific adenine glycosylase